MRLLLNGIDITNDVTEGLESFEIEIGLNTSTKTVGKTLSTDITVEGAAYDLLNAYFFDDCDSWQNTMPAIFITDLCGGLTIDCVVTSEGIERIVSEEKLSFNLKSSDEISRAYDRLDSEYIFENGFIENNDTPIMYYVDQSNWIQWTIILLTSWIRLVFNIIEKTIKAICEGLTLGFGKCDINITGRIFGRLDTWLSGTGRWTVAPLIREMVEYQCNAVGIGFVSSILNDPSSSRYNLSMFCLTGGEHGDYEDTSRLRVQEIFYLNSPLYTTIDLLEKLKEVFAADYQIINGILYFEREDYFISIKNKKILRTNDHCLEEPLEQSWKTDDAAAYGDYRYNQDAYDVYGNSLLKSLAKVGNYMDKVEYNNPYNPSQKGKKLRNLQFGVPRFMYDHKAFEKRGLFDFNRLMDEFRDGTSSFLESFIENEGLVRTNDLTITSNALSNEKLLILENGFNRRDALVSKTYYNTKKGKKYYLYNGSMMIDESATFNELVKDFFIPIDNPRLRKDKFTISDFTIECDCEAIKSSISDFQTSFVHSDEYGKIVFENIVLKFDSDKVSITFKNCVSFC